MSGSKLPPEGIINVGQNEYVGRKEAGTGTASAIPYEQMMQGPVYDQDWFEAQLGTGGTGPGEDELLRIHLPAGSTILCERYDCPRIKSHTRITTDPQNPATIMAKPVAGQDRNHVVQMIAIDGEDIQIQDVVVDFNTGGSWWSFLVGFKTNTPGGTDPAWPGPIRDISFRRIRFTDSTPPLIRSNGDNWCLNFDHYRDEPLQNLNIVECTHIDRPFTQLFSGGNGGINGALIKGNLCDRAEAGCLQFTSFRYDYAEAGIDVFEGIEFVNNTLLRGNGTNINISSDGTDTNVAIKNVTVRENFVELAGISSGDDFGQGVSMRADGDGVSQYSGYIDGLFIKNNVFSTLRAYAGGKNPRCIYASAPNGGTIDVNDNRYLGGVDNPIPANIIPVSVRRDRGFSGRGLEGYTIDDDTIINGELDVSKIATDTFTIDTTADAIVDLGDTGGNTKLIARNASGSDVAYLDSAGLMHSETIAVGIEPIDAAYVSQIHHPGLSGVHAVSSNSWCGFAIVADYAGDTGGPRELKFMCQPNTHLVDIRYQNVTEMRIGPSLVEITNLPTSDPVRAGQLWNEAGTVKVSAG